MLPSDTEEAELTETELDDQESVLPSSTTASELGDDDQAYSDKHEDDDWEASTKTPKAKQLRSTVAFSPSADYAQLKGRLQAVPKSSNNQWVTKLTKYMDNLDISEKDKADSIKKIYGKSHESLNVDDDDEEEIDLLVVKKKKRSVIL
jgi:kinesin family member 20